MLPCATKRATCGSIFDPARIRRELANIETRLADPALWNDPAASKPLMRDRKRLENLVADDEQLVRRTGDIDAYFELAREGEDVFADLLPTCPRYQGSRRFQRRPRSPHHAQRAKPIRSTPSSPSTPAPAAPRARIGPRC